MGMIYKSKNPIFLFVFLVSCVTLVILSKQIFYQTDKILLYFQMTFWLWTTLFLSSLIESVAILQNPDFQLTKVKNVTIPIVKKLSSNKYTIGDFNNYTEVPITKIKTGNLILLKTGDEVPFDGEVISGMCYVSDVDATGSSDHRLKSKDKDNILVAGSVIESDDFIIMKVRSSMNKSFFKKISKILQNIERQANPSQKAYERLKHALSI